MRMQNGGNSEASQRQTGSILGVFSMVFQVITAPENTFTRVSWASTVHQHVLCCLIPEA